MGANLADLVQVAAAERSDASNRVYDRPHNDVGGTRTPCACGVRWFDHASTRSVIALPSLAAQPRIRHLLLWCFAGWPRRRSHQQLYTATETPQTSRPQVQARHRRQTDGEGRPRSGGRRGSRRCGGALDEWRRLTVGSTRRRTSRRTRRALRFSSTQLERQVLPKGSDADAPCTAGKPRPVDEGH